MANTPHVPTVANLAMLNARDRWNTWRATYIRWVWLGITIALAATLVIDSYLNYRGIAAAAATLDRGQAQMLDGAQRALFGPREVVTAARADSFVRAYHGAGLRYYAVADSAGRVLVSAGEPAVPGMKIDLSQRRLPFVYSQIKVSGRVRTTFPRPPFGRPPGDTGREPAWPGNRRLRERPVSSTVMEFVPVAPALVAHARRALIVAWIGAGILTLANLLYWRTSREYDLVRQTLEEQRRLAVLGEMSAVLAHEIRNPLASLKGHAQLLAERLSSDTAEKRKADRVVDEAERLEALTNELLDFARSGPMDLQRVDPAAIVRSIVRDFPEGAVSVDTAGAPLSWLLDERRFSYGVLANVLRNAVHASPPVRPVEVRAFTERGGLVVTIRDHGAGLPGGEEGRIFDPFFTTRTTGTGLGLALARRIVELHGGRISAENADGGGARFRIELPDRRHLDLHAGL